MVLCDLYELRCELADDPAGLLARKATIRIFHYSGTSIEYRDTPNLLKAPKTISGPLIQQIADAYEYVLNEIATGLTMARSGFETVHRYPKKVVPGLVSRMWEGELMKSIILSKQKKGDVAQWENRT